MKYLLILSLIFFPFTSSAQIFSSIFTEDVVINLSPEIPAPKETVTATIGNVSYEDLKRSNVVWRVDGVEKKRGVGESTFQFQAPESGKNMEVFVTVEKTNGAIYSNFVNIKTASLDLIYEANTYIPPFYKGRSLFTPQSVATIAAVADMSENGVKLSKNRIIYNWYKNDELIVGASGVGKNSVQIEGGLLSKPFYISVIAEALNSNTKAEKRIYISSAQPKVVMYENNPIYGSIFEKALTGTFNFDREEVGITAIPYFFSTNDKSSANLKYSWFENGKKVGNDTFGSFINYINPNKERSGVSNLMVDVEHSNRPLQISKNSFLINVLGEQQSDTIEQNESTAF